MIASLRILACLVRRRQHRPGAWHGPCASKHTIGLRAFMSTVFNE